MTEDQGTTAIVLLFAICFLLMVIVYQNAEPR